MAEMHRAVVLGMSFAIASLALSGCSIVSDFVGSSSALSTNPATANASDTPATVGSAPSDSPTAVSIPCDRMLSLQNVYDYNPNYAEDPKVQVSALMAPVVAAGGSVCGWVNLSSGETFAVGVAQPGTVPLAEAANASAAEFAAVPTYGTGTVEGYFGIASDVGVADAYTATSWIRIVSVGFIEPGDAVSLMNQLLRNVG